MLKLDAGILLCIVVTVCTVCMYRSSSLTSPPPVSMGGGPSTDVLDMPVDPNEPTYCLCHQVSFGEMIGCDNIDVSQFFLSFVTDTYCNYLVDTFKLLHT